MDQALSGGGMRSTECPSSLISAITVDVTAPHKHYCLFRTCQFNKKDITLIQQAAVVEWTTCIQECTLGPVQT